MCLLFQRLEFEKDWALRGAYLDMTLQERLRSLRNTTYDVLGAVLESDEPDEKALLRMYHLTQLAIEDVCTYAEPGIEPAALRWKIRSELAYTAFDYWNHTPIGHPNRGPLLQCYKQNLMEDVFLQWLTTHGQDDAKEWMPRVCQMAARQDRGGGGPLLATAIRAVAERVGKQHLPRLLEGLISMTDIVRRCPESSEIYQKPIKTLWMTLARSIDVTDMHTLLVPLSSVLQPAPSIVLDASVPG
jgi:hypothetical protein